MEWLPKVNERITFALLSIKDHKDLSEHDWSVLEYFHKLHWLGELPFYKTVPDIKEEMTIQQGLFQEHDKVTEPIVGHSI